MSDHPHRRTFERVRDHLLRQGRRSRPEGANLEMSGCLNRTIAEDGTVLMCAVGCLIPEDRYDPRTEGMFLMFLGPYLDPELGLDISSDLRACDLLSFLRFTHDGRPVEEWPAILSTVETHLSPDGEWTCPPWSRLLPDATDADQEDG